MSTGPATTDNSSCSSMDSIELQQRLAEIEEEQAKLKAMRSHLAAAYAPLPAPVPAFKTVSPEEQAEADARSIYVGNVDYTCTDEDVKAHFLRCGTVTRVTIPKDKFRGTAKGFAYVEFVDTEARTKAVTMVDSMLKGRAIKVTEKRTNVRGLSTTNRFPSLNKVHRGHGGAIVKYVPVYAGRGAMRLRRPRM